MDKESPLSLQDKFTTRGIKEDGIISCKVDFFFFFLNLVNVFNYLLCGHESSWRLVRSSWMFAQMVVQLILPLRSM